MRVANQYVMKTLTALETGKRTGHGRTLSAEIRASSKFCAGNIICQSHRRRKIVYDHVASRSVGRNLVVGNSAMTRTSNVVLQACVLALRHASMYQSISQTSTRPESRS
jgi:hypothetical protein